MNKNSFQPKTKAKTKPSLLPLIIVFFVPVLLYLQTVSFGFIHFDDNDIIVENARFLSKISNVPQAFMTDAFITKISPFYRPMQTVSYIIDAQFSTENHPWMFHLSNIVLLGCIACVLLLLLKRFLIPPRLAFWATLLFCVHPLFVSTVAWIPARGDLLLTFFALLSFLFLIEYLQKNKTSYLIMHLITFIIALFCKETAAILPLLFITYYLSTAISKRIESKQLFAVIMYGIAGLCWFWLRSKAIGNFSDYNSKFGFTTFLSNIPTMLESVSQFFLPFPIAPIPGFSLFKTMTGIVILGVIIFLLFKNWKGSYKVNSFCFIWFLLLMVPPMFYFQPNIEYLNHRFFLPLIGLLVFLLHIFPKKWLQNGDIKNSKILLVIVVCLGSLTFINSRSYSNPVTYYDAVILQNPHSAFAYNNRGLLKSLHADELGATQDYEKAIAINSDYFDAYYNNGCAKAKLGDNPGAIENYNKAIALNQKSAGAFNNRGVAKANIGNNHGALEDYSKALEINPQYADAFNNRGIAKAILNDNTSAINDFTQAIAINSNFANAYYNRGSVYFDLHLYDKTIADFSKAIAIKPDYSDAYNNRGASYLIMGLPDKACSDFSKAAQLGNEKAKGNISIYCKGK